jgi:hypothetical protein
MRPTLLQSQHARQFEYIYTEVGWVSEAKQSEAKRSEAKRTQNQETTEIANLIYAEIIPRVLTHMLRAYLAAEQLSQHSGAPLSAQLRGPFR